MSDPHSHSNKLSWLQIIGSVLAATFGVQSQKTKERDFTHGEIKKFAIVAIAFTFVLLATLIGIVQLVTFNAS